MSYIDNMAHRPDLSAEMIARATAMSRSALYRAFESVGGVARYIMERRLAAIRRALMHPNETRTFAALARAHGFVSSSHASRSFKEAFGITPNEVRTAAQSAEASASVALRSDREVLARWSVELR